MTSAGASEPGLLRSFDSFEHAEAARTALLDAGLPPGTVRIEVLQDEAGPVEGNFLVGNGRPTAGAASRIAPGGGAGAPYEHNLSKVITRGVYLLVVDAVDPARRASMEALLATSPGLDVRGVAREAGAAEPPQQQEGS
ncbi:hypothetical protein [Variovorax sp. UMC13]|uniref:hypothetical protein n=1 Tax=Variovorax sp. UMC13 TaxID=1862326 RepID=UPI001603FFF3|nr:hypothetical protein [Variovorax sp. UMC13]MBB1600798.1 hypothetical protein [Variovorax sp. UMC13]